MRKNQSRKEYLVAIVGRPNVGKSTLFNKMIGQPIAIATSIPGTTRDILYSSLSWNKTTFTLIDTAGIELDNKSDLDKDVFLQTQAAIESADLIIFMTDVREGLHVEDKKAAELIRKMAKPVILAVNKSEGKKYDSFSHEFYKLGLGEPLLVSAVQGRGLGDLLDNTVENLKKIKIPKTKNSLKETNKLSIKISILGRPNVGKSTFFNKIIGQNRSIVSNQPGTTRDTVNATLDIGDTEIEFIDTAGLRKRGKIEQGIEKFSSIRLIRALKQSDIVLLLIEANEGVIAQDMHIAQMILEERKGFIFVVNKWDAIEKDGKTTAEYDRYLNQKFAFVKWAPHIYLSALTGQRVDKVVDMIKEVWESLNTKIPGKKLNTIIGDAYNAHPPKGKRRPPKIYFAGMSKVNPPTIKLKVNHPEDIHFSYLRYLENRLRKHFPLTGSPIKWELIKSSTK